MEHINSLFGTQLSGIKNLKLPNFRRSLSKVDSVFTVSMIIFGILGCLSVLYLQAAPNRNLDNSVILTGSSPGQTSIAAAAVISQNSSEKSGKQGFVQILGTRKAGSELTFMIDAFDADADYSFEFGNGKTLTVTDRSTTFSYVKSGLYKVFLNVTFQGETKRLPVESVWITK